MQISRRCASLHVAAKSTTPNNFQKLASLLRQGAAVIILNFFGVVGVGNGVQHATMFYLNSMIYETTTYEYIVPWGQNYWEI